MVPRTKTLALLTIGDLHDKTGLGLWALALYQRLGIITPARWGFTDERDSSIPVERRRRCRYFADSSLEAIEKARKERRLLPSAGVRRYWEARR